VPLMSDKYQAQMRGDPVLSVSGDLWPKTCTVMSLFLHHRCVCAPYSRRDFFVTRAKLAQIV
jgi:hypothetical protein